VLKKTVAIVVVEVTGCAVLVEVTVGSGYFEEQKDWAAGKAPI